MTESQRQRNKDIHPVSYLFSSLSKAVKQAWEAELAQLNERLEPEHFAVLVCFWSNYFDITSLKILILMIRIICQMPSVAAKFTCEYKNKLPAHLCHLGHYSGLWEQIQKPCGSYALLQQGEPRRGSQVPQREGQN